MANKQLDSSKREIALEIERVSEQMCIDHLGHQPDIWYTGGSDHNDDRLVAVVEDGDVRVRDGGASEIYNGDLAGVEKYVRDWLEKVWGASKELDDVQPAQQCQWGECTEAADCTVDYPVRVPGGGGRRCWLYGAKRLKVCAACAKVAKAETETRYPRHLCPADGDDKVYCDKC